MKVQKCPNKRAKNQRFPTGQLAPVLKQMDCPAPKSNEMAAQLIRLATQLDKTAGRAETEAVRYLLGIMRQG